MSVLAAVVREDSSYEAVLSAAGRLAGGEPFDVLSFYLSPVDQSREVAHESSEQTAGSREALAGQIQADLAASSLNARVHVPQARIHNTGDDIVRWAAEQGADVVVIGTHGRTGLDHALMGSVAERVVQRAHCDVHVTRVPKEG